MTSLIIAARPSVVTHSNKSTSAAWVQVSTRATGRKGRPFESRIVRHSNPQHRMSAWGQKRTSQHFRAMSALPQKRTSDDAGPGHLLSSAMSRMLRFSGTTSAGGFGAASDLASTGADEGTGSATDGNGGSGPRSISHLQRAQIETGWIVNCTLAGTAAGAYFSSSSHSQRNALGSISRPLTSFDEITSRASFSTA